MTILASDVSPIVRFRPLAACRGWLLHIAPIDDMALAALADLIVAELERLGVTIPKPGQVATGKGMTNLPIRPLELLRRQGRQLVVPVEAILDCVDQVVITAALDRCVIVRFPDGSKTVAWVDRLQVDGGAFRDVYKVNVWARQTYAHAEPTRRGRAASAAAKRRATRIRASLDAIKQAAINGTLTGTSL